MVHNCAKRRVYSKSKLAENLLLWGLSAKTDHIIFTGKLVKYKLWFSSTSSRSFLNLSASLNIFLIKNLYVLCFWSLLSLLSLQSFAQSTSHLVLLLRAFKELWFCLRQSIQLEALFRIVRYRDTLNSTRVARTATVVVSTN